MTYKSNYLYALRFERRKRLRAIALMTARLIIINKLIDAYEEAMFVYYRSNSKARR